MEIKAKIDRMIHNGKVKAIASVSLDEKFVVKNLRVVEGNKGLFVAFPQETYTDKSQKKQYSNIFFPTTNAAKYDLEDAVLSAYRQALNQGQSQGRSASGGYDSGYQRDYGGGYQRSYNGGYGVTVDDDSDLGMQM